MHNSNKKYLTPVFPVSLLEIFFVCFVFDPSMERPFCMSKVEMKILFLISFALDTNITAQGERKRHSQHSCLTRRRVFRLIINRQGPVPGT